MERQTENIQYSSRIDFYPLLTLPSAVGINHSTSSLPLDLRWLPLPIAPRAISSAFKESSRSHPLKHPPLWSWQHLENKDFIVAQSSLGLGDFDYAVPLGGHGIWSWKTALRGISSHPLMGQTGNCSLGQGKGQLKATSSPANRLCPVFKGPAAASARKPSRAARPALGHGSERFSPFITDCLVPARRRSLRPFSLTRIQGSFSKLSLQHSSGNVNPVIFFLNYIL